MRYKGAAFFDYDGTLSDEELGIYYPTEKTVNAINNLQKEGFFVCLSTGRAKCYAPKCSIGFNGYITSNGAYAEIEEKAVYRKVFSEQLYNEAAELFEKEGIYFSVENQKCCYALDKNEKNFKKMIENFNIPSEIFYPIDQIDKENVYKMLIAYPCEKAYNEVKKHFEGRLTFDKHRFCDSADVTVTGVTKADGVRTILGVLEVDPDNTYAFGDGSNDIEMFKAVKHSVAMGVSAQNVKDAAEYITASVEDEGIYRALEKYGLI